jgi:DUF4097 and DUF4098 domain-containing protein YvlB
MKRRSLSIGLASLLLGLTGCGSSPVRVTRDFSLDVPWQDYDRIIVRTVNGSVRLSHAEGAANATVSGSKQAGGLTLAEADRNVELLEVFADADPANPRRLLVELRYPDELRHRNIGASFVIGLPKPVGVDVSTGNGRIDADGLAGPALLHTSNGDVVLNRLSGDAEIRTSNGDVHARDVAGLLRAESSNGDIVVHGVGGDCSVETTNGGVEITQARGSIEVLTSNGRVRVEGQPPAEGRVKLVSSNGGIHATLPSSMKGKLDLSCSNGGVHTELGPMTLSRPHFSRRAIEAEMNGGGGGQIICRTSNGSITLNCR